jgi:hypothetical protein
LCGHLPLALRLARSTLADRIYKAAHSDSRTKRYFIDRFPIFFPEGAGPGSLPPQVTFTYCDAGDWSLARYATHLRSYKNFLQRLPTFNFIYAAPEPAKFSRAAALFHRIFEDSERVSAKHLSRYFEVRRLWDAGKYKSLTRTDRDLLREGDQRYTADGFQSAYQKWLSGSLRPADLDPLLDPAQPRQERNFRTYVLPEPYAIFYTEAARDYRTSPRDRCSTPRSISRSTACEA